jgi:hypothetical protein
LIGAALGALTDPWGLHLDAYQRQRGGREACYERGGHH